MGYGCELIPFLSVFHFHLSKYASLLLVALLHLISNDISNVLKTLIWCYLFTNILKIALKSYKWCLYSLNLVLANYTKFNKDRKWIRN